MTLSDTTFQRMRDYVLMMRSIELLQEVVTCSLPFHLTKEDIVAIELVYRVLQH
jgi:hypothetical protein